MPAGLRRRVVRDLKTLRIPAWYSPRRISDADAAALIRLASESREPAAMKWLRQVWAAAGRQFTDAEVADIIRTGTVRSEVREAIRAGYKAFADDRMTPLMKRAAGDAGGPWAEGAGFTFDQASARLTDALVLRADRLAVELARGTLETIDLLVQYHANGAAVPAGDLALLFRQFVPMTSREAGAVLALREELVADGRGLGAIRRLTSAYAEKLTQGRALRIARTEISFASNRGQREALDQARDLGIVTGQVVKEWSAANDEVVCPICGDLDGQRAAEDGEFDGGIDSPPAHPNCRCALKWLELVRK